jgi:hypothetical protein
MPRKPIPASVHISIWLRDGFVDATVPGIVAAVEADPALRTLGWVKRWYRPAKAASRFSHRPQPTWPRAANSQIRCLGLFHGAGLSLRPIDLADRPDTLKANRYVRAAPVRTNQGDPSCPQEKTFRFPEWCRPETARRFI